MRRSRALLPTLALTAASAAGVAGAAVAPAANADPPAAAQVADESEAPVGDGVDASLGEAIESFTRASLLRDQVEVQLVPLEGLGAAPATPDQLAGPRADLGQAQQLVSDARVSLTQATDDLDSVPPDDRGEARLRIHEVDGQLTTLSASLTTLDLRLQLLGG